jgi:cyclophilin family peptidyl-prolyl cis-trans isomerase
MLTPRSLLAALVLLTVPVAGCGDKSSSNAGGSTSSCAKADGTSPRTTTFKQAPPMCLVDGMSYRATVVTNHGTLHITLRADIAPVTVNSFVNLARFHYFDGTTCHRAVRNFVVQCGDPTATGHGGPGYTIPDELTKIEPYRIGSLAMAKSALPNSGGSQFFLITGDDGAALPPKYTLFGQVDDNDMGVVQALDAVANPADGPPLTPIDIQSVTIDVS